VEKSDHRHRRCCARAASAMPLRRRKRDELAALVDHLVGADG
jgi:hypothetical protein